MTRARIVEATGIPTGHIMISAAHNHSGPSGFTRMFVFGGGFVQRLFDFLAAAVAWAEGVAQWTVSSAEHSN